MYVFYFLALIVIWLGVLSLRGGFRFSSYVRREGANTPTEFSPYVSVIAPCRGVDQGLEQNLSALFHQNYPGYQLIFVTSAEDDPAVELIKEITLQESTQTVNAQLIFAGPAKNSGQKVHNLSIAVEHLDPLSEVLVFVDSDARTNPLWLKSLVAPLVNKELGAATGYRWFVPVNGNFASHLRSVWNASIASALGENIWKNFCWGGSTAIRRTVFEDLKIKERWIGTVSDDFTLTRTLNEAKLPIHFTPSCLVPSFEDCDFRELAEFTNRQLKITRVYAPQLWKPLLIGSFLFCFVFFGGMFLVLIAALQGRLEWKVSALVLLIFVLGALKSYVRLRAVRIPLRAYGHKFRGNLLAHITLWPIASLVYLFNAVTAAFSRRIEWRGITYELKSPTEAVIIDRQQ
jgi:ceramide glucosyltransferase